jgi:dihydrolipoamide dehydrogenase
MLAHTASHEGIVAANNASNKDCIMRYEAVPSVIFTLPEISSVGFSEKKAIEKGYDIISSTFPLSYLGKAQAALETKGFVKIIADKETKQVLGAHMFGNDASTMIAEMTLAINNELTLDCITETIHAHPTLSEAWLESALIANNHPIHFPPLRK